MNIQITLSRAHKVVERLKALMSEQSAIAHQCLTDVSLSSNMVNAGQVNSLNARTAKGLAAIADYERFNAAWGMIRNAVGKANVTSGVSELLTQQETLSRQKGFLSNLSSNNDMNALQITQVADFTPVAATNSGRYNSDSISINMLSDDQRTGIANKLAEITKTIYVISDKVADANANKISFVLDDDLAGLLGLA